MEDLEVPIGLSVSFGFPSVAYVSDVGVRTAELDELQSSIGITRFFYTTNQS